MGDGGVTPASLSTMLHAERDLVREIDAARAELARLNAEQVERKAQLASLRAEIRRARDEQRRIHRG